nr:hypothetical protein [Pseudomonas sp. s4]
MTNKTPSQLVDFTGDKSMYLHAQKPGKSERVSIDYLTKDSLKSGDIVLKPTANHAGFHKCDGSVIDSSQDTGLASSLAMPAFGARVSSVNQNSEVRFGTDLYKNVCAYKNYVFVSNDTHYAIFKDGQEYENYELPGTNYRYFSSKDFAYRTYVYDNSVVIEMFVGESFMPVKWYDQGVNVVVAGAASYKQYSILDSYREFVAVVEDGYFKMYEVSVDKNQVYTEVGVFTGSAISCNSAKIISISDYLLAIRFDNKFYDLMFFGDIPSLSLFYTSQSVGSEFYGMQRSTMSQNEPNKFFYTSNGSDLYINDKLYSYENLTQEQIVLPAGTNISNISGLNDNFIVISDKNNGSIINSFDGGITWQQAPVMSGYCESVYNNGAVYSVGGTGTTGSVSNNSGSVQVNSVIFNSREIIFLPKFEDGVNGISHYIKR